MDPSMASGSQALSTRGFTVAEAAELLGLTPQAVRNRSYTRIPGVRPALLAEAEIVADLEVRARRLESELEALRATAKRLAVEVELVGPSGDRGADARATGPSPSALATTELLDQDSKVLQEKLEAERTGRAVAEGRIDSLKEDLRRANATIAGLLETIGLAQARPDLDMDRAP